MARTRLGSRQAAQRNAKRAFGAAGGLSPEHLTGLHADEACRGSGERRHIDATRAGVCGLISA